MVSHKRIKCITQKHRRRQSRLQQMAFINTCSLFFLEKIRLDVSSESSARQRIHMKNQALFSSKRKSKKKIKCRLLQILFGALRVKIGGTVNQSYGSFVM